MSISLKAALKWPAKRSKKHHAAFTSAMFQPFPPDFSARAGR
ncbi:hypothetical protein A0R60_2532 [Enterobacter asburiae]|nr:hypothetical protein A0R60_2532 [Enterobacter asburiae]